MSSLPPGLRAADVMTTDVVTITEHDSVAAAWELLSRGRFHHLPVVRGRRCVGMLDDRRLLRATTPGSVAQGRRVAEILPPEVVTVAGDTLLEEVARVLSRTRSDAAAVVEADGTLVGVLTSADLIDVLAGVPPMATSR